MKTEIKNDEVKQMIKSKLILSDGSAIHLIGGDYFLIKNTGEIKLLLQFTINEHKRRRWIEIKKFILVDKGIGRQG